MTQPYPPNNTPVGFALRNSANRFVAKEVIHASNRCEHRSSVPAINFSSLSTSRDFRCDRLARNSLNGLRSGSLARSGSPEGVKPSRYSPSSISPASATLIFFAICRQTVCINCPSGRSTSSGSRRRAGGNKPRLISKRDAAPVYSNSIEWRNSKCSSVCGGGCSSVWPWNRTSLTRSRAARSDSM